jgi:hypothetical protein
MVILFHDNVSQWIIHIRAELTKRWGEKLSTLNKINRGQLYSGFCEGGIPVKPSILQSLQGMFFMEI